MIVRLLAAFSSADDDENLTFAPIKANNLFQKSCCPFREDFENCQVNTQLCRVLEDPHYSQQKRNKIETKDVKDNGLNGRQKLMNITNTPVLRGDTKLFWIKKPRKKTWKMSLLSRVSP